MSSRLFIGSAVAAAALVLVAAGTQTDWELRLGASGGRLQWSFEQCQCQTTSRRPITHHSMFVHHWACKMCKRAQNQACLAIEKRRGQHWHEHHLAWVSIAASGLILLAILAIVQSSSPSEEQAQRRRYWALHRKHRRMAQTPNRTSARRSLDLSYMSPEAVDLQNRQPGYELAGALAKAKARADSNLDDLDNLSPIARVRRRIRKSLFGERTEPDLRV